MNEILAKVIEIVSEESGEQVAANSQFETMGIDSLEFLCILSRVRVEVGSFPDYFVESIQTVSDLAGAVVVAANAKV